MVMTPAYPYIPDAGRNAFNSVTVSSDCRLKKTIRWSVRPSFQDKEGWFRVERSIQNGPWEQEGELTDGLSLETDFTPVQEPDRLAWWRVVLIGRLGEYASEPVQEGFAPAFFDLQYAHIIYRREYLTLIRYSGVKGSILHKRETGPLCPVCSDEGSGGAPLRSNCQSCDGTGRLGGFYPSEEMYVFIQGAADATQRVGNQLGTVAPGEKVRARTAVTGWITTYDIWVNGTTGDRYMVTAIKPEVVYKDYVITYALEMERLPFGHTNVINTPSVLAKLPSAPSSETGCGHLSVDDFR